MNYRVIGSFLVALALVFSACDKQLQDEEAGVKAAKSQTVYLKGSGNSFNGDGWKNTFKVTENVGQYPNVWHLVYTGNNFKPDVTAMQLTFTNGEVFEWTPDMGPSVNGGGNNPGWVIYAPYDWAIAYVDKGNKNESGSWLITNDTKNINFNISGFTAGKADDVLPCELTFFAPGTWDFVISDVLKAGRTLDWPKIVAAYAAIGIDITKTGIQNPAGFLVYPGESIPEEDIDAYNTHVGSSAYTGYWCGVTLLPGKIVDCNTFADASGLNAARELADEFMSGDYCAAAKEWVGKKHFELYAINPCEAFANGYTLEEITKWVSDININANIEYAKGLCVEPIIVNLGFVGYYLYDGKVLNTSFYWQTLKEGDNIDWDAVDAAYADWVAKGGLEPDRTLWKTSGYATFTFEDYAQIGFDDFNIGQLENYYKSYYVSPGYKLPAEDEKVVVVGVSVDCDELKIVTQSGDNKRDVTIPIVNEMSDGTKVPLYTFFRADFNFQNDDIQRHNFTADEVTYELIIKVSNNGINCANISVNKK